MISLKPFLLTQISTAHLVSHIHMMALPALMPLMSEQTEMTFIEIGFAISIFNIVSALLQTPMGFVVDRIGPKRVLIFALLLGSLSFLSLGIIGGYFWLIIAMILAGTANSVYHPSDYALLSQGIDDKRMGRAFSIHTFSGFAGTAITPALMLGIASVSTIELAFTVSGIIGILAIFVLLPSASNAPVKMTKADKLKTADSSLMVKPKMKLMSTAIFLLLILFLLISLSSGSIQNFSVSALVTGYNLPLSEANIALTVFLVASAVGVLVGGQLADYTRRHGMIAAIALIFTSLLAVAIASLDLSSVVLIGVMGVMGFCSGIIAPSRDMLVRDASPKGAEGRVFGIVSTGFNLGGTIGPILFGWILDHNLPRGIFWLAALFMLLTAMIAMYQEVKGTKRK